MAAQVALGPQLVTIAIGAFTGLRTAAAILATLGTSLSSGAAELTASQLTDLARDPSLHISAKSCTVVGTGPSITVLAEEAGKTADQNLKIDALFLSKLG